MPPVMPRAFLSYNDSTMATRGKFIVIEGPDGSGKTEQFERLTLRLPESVPFRTVHFPRYEEPSSYFVREYLAGNYGTLAEIGPEKASLFYALDRYDAGVKQLSKWLAEGTHVIVDRYMGSNMGHQGAKIENHEDRARFFKWLYDLEYGILKIPKPDLNIILHVPAKIAQTLRAKSGKNPDLHEKDFAYLERTEKVYMEVAELFPDDFTVIECAPDGKLLSIDEIHEQMWAKVKGELGI